MNIAEAKDLGAAAFQTDGPRAVVLRADFERFLTADGNLNQSAVRAYIQGWDEANLAAPVA